MPELTPYQIADLQKRYADLVNYQSNDPIAPIDPLNWREPGGDSLLHIAALRGDEEVVSLLLGAGIDPNIQGDMGYTPLHYAAHHRHRKTADILISHGASASAFNELGRAPDLSAFPPLNERTFAVVTGHQAPDRFHQRVVRVLCIEGDLVRVKFGGDTIQLAMDEIRPVSNISFEVGDRVRCGLGEATIRDIIWHFNDGVANYYLEMAGKKVSKRYLDRDLEPAMGI